MDTRYTCILPNTLQFGLECGILLLERALLVHLLLHLLVVLLAHLVVVRASIHRTVILGCPT